MSSCDHRDDYVCVVDVVQLSRQVCDHVITRTAPLNIINMIALNERKDAPVTGSKLRAEAEQTQNRSIALHGY